MAKKMITCFIAAILIVAMTAPALAYKDVPEDHWAFDYVEYATEHGIMTGMDTENFKPDRPINMLEICQILYNLADKDPPKNNNQILGYVRTRTGLQIDGDSYCTRIFLAHVIYRLKGRPEVDLSNAVQFSDLKAESEDAKKAVSYCVGAGLMSGKSDGLFHAYDLISRAEAAKVLVLYSGIGVVQDEAKRIAKEAEKTGIYVDIKNRADEDKTRSWEELLIYTPDGCYEFTHGGSIVERGWIVKTADGFEAASTDFVVDFIKELGAKFTDAEKFAVAKKQFLADLEEIGLFPEITSETETSFRFQPFGGLEKSVLPYALSDTDRHASLSCSNGKLEVRGNRVLSVADYLNELRGKTERLTPAERAKLAALWLEAFAKSHKWEAKLAERNSLTYEVKCCRQDSDVFYLFVIEGASTGINWYSESSNKKTALTRESVKSIF